MAAAIAAVRGVIPLLVQRLRNSGVEVREAVISVLSNLSRGSQEASAAIASEGAIPLLVQRLVNGSSDELKLRSAGVLTFMLVDNPDLCAAIVAAGGIPAFQQFLRSGGISQEDREVAADVLSRLSSHGQAEPAAASTSAGEGSIIPAAAHAAAVATGAEAADAPNEAGPADPAVARVCTAEGCNNTEHLRLCSG
jgi:hypothetical protein